MREGQPNRDEHLAKINRLAQSGAQFVYSTPHIEECRASDRPESYVEAIEKISALWFDPTNLNKRILEMPFLIEQGTNRAREKICAERDFAEDAEQLMNSLLQIQQFSVGWLGTHTEEDLRSEIENEIDTVLASWERQDPDLFTIIAPILKELLVNITRGMDLQTLTQEAQHSQAMLRARLPQNLAQLDQIPDEEVVEYLFNCLDSEERDCLLQQFPRGFWSDIPQRKVGDLAGFSFMLFMMGLTREKKVKSKGISKRKKHFISQFRDCRHIEIASRCAVFVTFDGSAARLASAAYAYAGAKTMVIHLMEKGGPSGPPLS